MLKKILITGATGFFGSALAKALTKEGYPLIILKRSFSSLERIQEILPVVSLYDIDKVPLSTPFQELPDIVIHTATCYGKNQESPLQLFESNVHFPLQLLDLCSSRTPFFINTDTFSPKSSSLYALGKTHFKEWGKTLERSGLLKFINVRLEHLYGPKDNPHKFTMKVIHHLLANLPYLELTSGEQTRDFIYIDDAVSAYLLLIRQLDNIQKHEEFNLGTGKETSIRSFVHLLQRLIPSSTELRFGALPHPPFEVMHSKANLKALSSFGWKSTISLEEGIKRTIDGA